MAEGDDQNGDKTIVVDIEEQHEAPSELEKKIIRQVEYYYGDFNIVRDKFLRDQVGPNYDKWVPLETMVKFKRLADLSTDFEVIVGALRKSAAGLIEVNDDGKSIRRSVSRAVPLLTTEYRLESKAKTVYIKSFPPETTLDQLQEFFDHYGKVASIFMRRSKEKEFKGSVFVEFSNVAEAKKFLEVETVQFEGTELQRSLKSDYWQKKDKKMRQRRDEARKEQVAASAAKRVKQEGGDGDDDDDDQQQGDEKKEQGDEKQPGEGSGDEGQAEEQHDPCCVLHFENVGEQTSREDLKELFHEKEEVCWIDFMRGQNWGYVRFRGEGSAKRAMDSLMNEHSGKLEIRGVETTLRVLEGEEEKEFWKKVAKERKKSKAKGKRGRGQKRGWSRGGRGRGESRAKRSKTH